MADAAAVVVVDVDNDGEYVPDASACPFLPLTPETVLCIMQWYRYVRRFGSTDQGQSAAYFLTDTYTDFLAHFYVDCGAQAGAAGVAINLPMHFTVDEVTYDTVSCRFVEFVRLVYDGSAEPIPETYHCWRDLVMFMAVQASDSACHGIIQMPSGARALVCELARRMNCARGIGRFSLSGSHKACGESEQASDMSDEESCDEHTAAQGT